MLGCKEGKVSLHLEKGGVAAPDPQALTALQKQFTDQQLAALTDGDALARGEIDAAALSTAGLPGEVIDGLFNWLAMPGKRGLLAALAMRRGELLAALPQQPEGQLEAQVRQ